ncbi:rhodanese-related sulfurtransferase [Balneolales bacterium ANBcel1]|nr:rhodanese-related sulfurtransferase [Balneolales bacterium ANBcel1]
MSTPYSVILFYQFARIESPENMVAEQKQLCSGLGLKGRIYISDEGINGTLSGKTLDITGYKDALRSKEGFSGTEFKEDFSDEVPFAKLIVKHRPELVSLKSGENLDPLEEGGRHLSPDEWRRVMESGEDYIMIDVRNNYESRIGYFEGAQRPDVENFYDFPNWLDGAGIPKNKKVLMYCTGGIRCEKFSVLMKKKGYRDVNQLHGGILNYANKQAGRHFRGKCFVFDDRLVVPVNPEEQEPVSFCEITGDPCDMYINCANMECNRLFICSPKGAERMEGCCSESCRQNPRRRPFNPDKAYAPFRKWYHYFDVSFKQGKHQRTGLSR